jgi:hypothetical protein
LPFWRRVLLDCRVDDAYVLAIRNPASVAASLYARQRMDSETAARLWLVNMVPYLRAIAGKPLVVVDYDLLMRDPRAQLERISQRLELPRSNAAEIERFANEFLDSKLQHTVFSPDEIEASTDAGRLTRDAFLLLYELASDEKTPGAEFWRAWESVESSFDRLRMTTTGSGW